MRIFLFLAGAVSALVLAFVAGFLQVDVGFSLTKASSQDHSEHEHQHSSIAYAEAELAPRVEHTVVADVTGGYNVEILTRNFLFTPASSGEEIVANEGHAHLYVNGTKVARIYGDWFHLSDEYFVPGTNHVSVTLNANDHTEWATAEGEPIRSTVIVEHPAQ